MKKFRMYSLVLRQLSSIQKGVQSAHSIVEYAQKFNRTTEYSQWATVDKTLIILDGGTYQEMKECKDFLKSVDVPYSTFCEPDLGDIVTSISFIIENNIYDSKEFPSFEEDGVNYEEMSQEQEPQWLKNIGGIRNLKIRNFLKSKRLSI